MIIIVAVVVSGVLWHFLEYYKEKAEYWYNQHEKLVCEIPKIIIMPRDERKEFLQNELDRFF